MKAAVLALSGKETILTDIPVLKWMISGIKITSNISTILSIRKFNAFIIPIKKAKYFRITIIKKNWKKYVVPKRN